jgi:hypothetical protein
VISIHPEADPGLLSFLEQGYGLVVNLALRTSRSWEGFSGLSFFARSNLLGRGGLEYRDDEHERSFCAADIYLNDTWARIRVPFEEMEAEGAKLSDAKAWTRNPSLCLSFDVPTESLRQAATEGSLEIELALDHLVLE